MGTTAEKVFRKGVLEVRVVLLLSGSGEATQVITLT